ncbi:MOSC domain-containing protein [Deinococcus taeanensis]|uniref:MOSC domain-containing protein n=1 Tax=Deinococcus taeanensis TaxID=2737050 RepID=UPI001CDCA317|nr:MOSC domain-containing protein [Deinococcus taeanensis]UBV43848.1 MOSC domain-containing protein [Deinococcus taeanensis]
MQLLLTAVCVGQPAALSVGTRETVTGIDKRAVPLRVPVTPAGLDGDHVLNRQYHGGPDQAVYAYTVPDYACWADYFGALPVPGTFGENLVLSGLDSAALRVGDRLTVHGPDGNVTLEVTAPRIPCATLAARLQDDTFVRRFAQGRRPGAYLRVLTSGTLGAGDPVSVASAPAGSPTLGELFDLGLGARPDRATLEGYLQFPLAERLRGTVRDLLA